MECHFDSDDDDVRIYFMKQKRNRYVRYVKITFLYYNGNITGKKGNKQIIILKPNQMLP